MTKKTWVNVFKDKVTTFVATFCDLEKLSISKEIQLFEPNTTC